MATAGYNMKFGKGYLGGSKEKAMPHETHPENEGGDDLHGEIHAHLSKMHEATGHAHSHIEHHADGHHTSHHISAEGEHSGPHDHENLEALKDHMDRFLGEEENEDEDGY